MLRTLKCIFINVNSIVSRHKRHYFNQLLINSKPDVVVLLATDGAKVTYDRSAIARVNQAQ